MNERIERLLKQATVVTEGWSDENGTTRYYSVDQEKFAELIVRECVAQCWAVSEIEHKGNVISECSKRMRKHFGVEE